MTDNPMIVLGATVNRDLVIDLPVLIESRVLVQAQSGAGKSWALRRLLEQTHGAVQQIIIDPEGEFGSLREKFDYVLAGKGGDTPAEPRSAKLLARRLYELGVSAIVDISELQRHEQIRFVRLFLEALIAAPKEHRHEAIVVIDEAHIFCPEKGQAESAQAVIDLCTLGRKRGLCAVLATQRLSKLHKDAAAELRNKLIGATGLDIDQVRAGDDLGFSKADRLQLRDLKPGQFFAYGPALSSSVVAVTVGPVVSRHPKVGERGISAPPAPTEKIRQVLAKLADLPAEAEQEAKTIEDLKRDNADLRRKLTLADKSQRVETQPCDHEHELERIAAEAEDFRRTYAQAESELESVYAANEEIAAELEAQAGYLRKRAEVDKRAPVLNPARSVKRNVETPPVRQVTPPRSTNGHKPAPTGDLIGITGGALRMMERLAERYPETWTRSQLATLAKIKKSGGTFGTYLSRLLTRGLIVEQDGRVSITDEGLALMGGPPPQPQSHDDLLDSWRERLTGGARRMFEVLIDAGEDGLSREALADRAEITLSGGTFGTYLSRLMTNGLAEKRGEYVAATDLILGVYA